MAEPFEKAWGVVKNDDTHLGDLFYGVCPLCGYDAEEAVRYQSKQNDETLSPEEYAEEVDFYLHHHQCPAKRP